MGLIKMCISVIALSFVLGLGIVAVSGQDAVAGEANPQPCFDCFGLVWFASCPQCTGGTYGIWEESGHTEPLCNQCSDIFWGCSPPNP